jgi:hypothetical protein
MTQNILSALASSKVRRVLFVGCKAYTARYGEKLIRAGIDYWTVDVDPEAAIWGEQDHHITCDIANIGSLCPAESFDAVLLNGVIGDGINDEDKINAVIRAIAHILRPKGILLIGWNSQKRHPDPTELDAAGLCFCREQVLGLPLRQTFHDTDHVYDWLVKTS